VVLLGAEVNAAIYHALPDGMTETKMLGSLDNETTDDTYRRRMNDV
jgi:hypothetical protein